MVKTLPFSSVMNVLNNWKPLLLLLIVVFGISCRHEHINVYDGFEASGLSKIWSTGRMKLSSFEIQPKIVRKGKSAAKITLRTGDIVESATDKDKASERDELMETHSLFSLEGVKYEYQFSMFLPDSFPIVPVRLVIAQWKQSCFACSCSEYSPILAIRYVSGRLFITLQTDSVRQTLYELDREIRNCWLDFRFQIKFSRQKDGEVKAFLDDKEIVNYKGVTSYPESCGVFSKKNKYYFKMGLYRDRIPEPMSIYIDEYGKREIVDDKQY